MDKDERIMKRVQEHYDYLKQKGYEIVFLALQGSQNYGLDVYDEEYMSDVDTKAVILPSFEDFVYNRRPESETIVLDNNEHIDVKDVRPMFENYKKQNINFVETLFTKYMVINPKYKDLVDLLLKNREEVAYLNYNQALKCMSGMSMEKLKALKHPYPATKDKIDKFGYDPKQLNHILRINDFIKKYTERKSYAECLIPDNKEWLIEVKKGILPELEAEILATEMDANTRYIKDCNMKANDEINQKAVDILDKVKYELLKRKFQEDLKIEIPKRYSYYDECGNRITILDKQKLKKQLKADDIAFEE